MVYELKRARLKNIQNSLEKFNSRCSDATKDSHLFYAAVKKGWFRSAGKIRTRINRNISDFSHHLQQFKSLADGDETKLPQLADVFAELTQIKQDFGELNFDFNEKTISVTTESVELDGILFGSFEIRLSVDEISKLYDDSTYRVVALEPNPAATDDNVTHPHVSSERLCEGNGHIAIRRAIEQGRLCDFFAMVTSILQTYNPDSPYVSLSDWDGFCCYDCGYTISGDECYYCEDCERDYCSSCSTYCQICDTTICPLHCCLQRV